MDMEIDPDDEVVGARGTTGRRPRGPLDPAVPKVVDATAEKVRESFEAFLEEYVFAQKLVTLASYFLLSLLVSQSVWILN